MIKIIHYFLFSRRKVLDLNYIQYVLPMNTTLFISICLFFEICNSQMSWVRLGTFQHPAVKFLLIWNWFSYWFLWSLPTILVVLSNLSHRPLSPCHSVIVTSQGAILGLLTSLEKIHSPWLIALTTVRDSECLSWTLAFCPHLPTPILTA